MDIWRITQQVPIGGADGVVTDPRTRRSLFREAMRSILAGYLGVECSELRIERAPNGKPRLCAPEYLSFNLSHCVDMALVAVVRSGLVGVDVETQRKFDDPLRVARYVLPPDELEALVEIAPEHRAEAFLHLWTRFEARQKAIGNGLFGSRVVRDSVTAIPFCPDPGYFACVAVAPPDAEVSMRFFDYQAA